MATVPIALYVDEQAACIFNTTPRTSGANLKQ